MTLACCSADFSFARQAVDARLQDAGERRRHAHVEQLVGADAPRLAVGDDDAVVDQHADQLFDEVRVAFGAAREQVAQRRRHGLEPAEQGLDQLARAALGERREVDAQVLAAAAAPERPALVERRARQAEQQHRQVARSSATRWLMKSSEPSSAQCRSSRRRTIGAPVLRSRARKYDDSAWKARSRICLASLAMAAMCGSAP